MLENTLLIAVQKRQTVLEIQNDNSILVHCMYAKDTIPVNISLLVDQCFRFKDSFLCRIIRNVDSRERKEAYCFTIQPKKDLCNVLDRLILTDRPKKTEKIIINDFKSKI